MFFKTFSVFALVLASSSMSQAITLDCQVAPNASAGGYITERYVFQQDNGASEAIVSDGLILYFNDNQPLLAKVSSDTSKKIAFTWDVQITNNTGQQTRMLFRASYFKADGTIIVRATASGFTNQFEARGRCKTV